MKRLILVRHGETIYSLQEKCCGQKDAALNVKGVKQAEQLQAKLKNVKVDRVYSSDLKRAYQTAKIIFNNKIIHKRKGLREIDFGQFTGLTYKEISRLYPSIYKTLMDNLAKAKMPKGESIHNFAKRVERSFNKIFEQNAAKTVAIVCHINPIRIIFLKILKQKLDKFWNIRQDVAAVNIIEFKRKIPKVIKINDTG